MTQSVLIVEPDAVLARHLGHFFERAGYDTGWVASAVDAERRTGLCRPDLVILTHQPPAVDGLALLRHLRRHDPGVPTIMLADQATVELAVAAIKLGAAEFLAKPVALARLRQAVATLLGAGTPPAAVGYFRMQEEARLRASGRC